MSVSYVPREKSRLRKEITIDESDLNYEPPRILDTRCYKCERLDNARKLRFNSCSNSLLGGFEESLLQSRTSGYKMNPRRFKLQIHNRKVTVVSKFIFDAFHYSWNDDSFSPYVTTINMMNEKRSRIGEFPGFKIEQNGEMIFRIFNENGILINEFNYHSKILKKMDENTKYVLRKKTSSALVQFHVYRYKGQIYMVDDLKIVFRNHRCPYVIGQSHDESGGTPIEAKPSENKDEDATNSELIHPEHSIIDPTQIKSTLKVKFADTKKPEADLKYHRYNLLGSKRINPDHYLKKCLHCKDYQDDDYEGFEQLTDDEYQDEEIDFELQEILNNIPDVLKEFMCNPSSSKDSEKSSIKELTSRRIRTN